MEAACPNCGHTLSDFRTDRQPAGRRWVILYWMICNSCGHIALRDWSFVELEEVREAARYRRA